MKKFEQSFEELQHLVAAIDEPGEWSSLEHGHQYRGKSGAILNWYPSTGTVTYGGPAAAKTRLSEKIASVLGDVGGLESQITVSPAAAQSRIFVVHGHDDTAREQLELVIHKLGLQPYVLANTVVRA